MELQIDPAAPRLLHADQALRPSSSVACPCRTQAWACEHRYSVLRLGWLVVGSQTCCLSCSRGHAICTDGTLCEGYGRQLPNGRQSTTAQRGRARTRRSSWRSTPLTRALWLPSRVDRAWAGAALRCAAPSARCCRRACDSITESIHFTPVPLPPFYSSWRVSQLKFTCRDGRPSRPHCNLPESFKRPCLVSDFVQNLRRYRV